MLQLFADALCIKHTFTLTTVATDPLEAVVFEELGHLNTLLLVVVTFDRKLRNLVNAIVASGHRQL